MDVVGRPRTRGRLTPARPLGEQLDTDMPTCAPLSAGVGLDIPERGDQCDTRWFQVQNSACDIDDPDPPPLTRRQRTTD